MLRSLRSLRVLVLLVAFGLALRPARAQETAAEAPTDEQVLAAFARLAPDVQAEAVEWFAAECERLPSFQRGLVDHAIRALGRDPLGWPEAPAPHTYDSGHHTPGQVIPRTFVDTARGPHAEVVKRMLRKVPARELVPAFTYDWAQRSVVRVGDLRDPERVARNAVRGLEPRHDLVESIVLALLDSGAYEAEAKAFAHAYADRSGNAYRELTLYDAWASGADMEMPDVECLGIVHDLTGDWKQYVAPVPPTQHERLYKWIGERFVPYHRARALRTALARSYLLAEPVQRDGYGPSEGRLHAFWERVESDPAALAATLPDGQAWAAWLDEEGAKVDKDLALWKRAEARRAALRESQAHVRRTFVGILRELGAFEAR